MATTGKAKPVRHVYKTGAAGCGGKVTTTAPKNSGLPLPCPLCDRIFKQDGRLKEHLKNKHADERPDGLLAAPDCDSLHMQAAPEGSDEYINEGRAKQQHSYPIKTPKTLLHEWCQKNKRPVPKFKHVEVGGGFHCRIVLPDAKKAEADVILWYRDTPTRSSQEAQHRAAVVGLHHVLGNRRLDRILGEEYRQQWRDLDSAAERRRLYLQANPQQPRPKSAPLPRELHSVYMSEDNRRLVEGLLREHEDGADASGESPCSQSGDANGDESRRQRLGRLIKNVEDGRQEDHSNSTQRHSPLEETAEQPKTLERGSTGWRDSSADHRTIRGTHAFRRKLLSLGFKGCHVNTALIGNHDLSSALDWLILNVPEQELPTKFAPDASKASVQVLVRSNLAPPDTSLNVNEGSVSRLEEYGYPFEDCFTALSAANGDEGMALCKLFHSAFDDDLKRHYCARFPSGSPTEIFDIREEEVGVLSAISEAGTIRISESFSVFDITISNESAANLEMEVRITRESTYPFEVPVIAFRSRDLAGEFLLDLTKEVARKAKSILGRAMIHELVVFATNVAQKLSSRYKPTWDLRATSSSIETVCPLLSEVEEPGGNIPVSCVSSAIRSTSDLANIPRGKNYVPPALRNAACGTANEEKLKAPNSHADLQPRSKVRDPGAEVFFEKENAKLKIEWEHLQKSLKHAAIWAVRSRLPAFHQRGAVLSAVKSHHVTVIAGQTGCGKSTQVPQYVFEDYIERDEGIHCNIIVTQPRRLSAIGVADRVSKERGQTVGATIGYSVRLESNRSQRTRILFCTTGILLRRLLSDPDLEGVTHVIVDEVHERSLDNDLLLLLLRKLLTRLGGRLRVILMSATVDTALFVRYFREEMLLDPYVVHIPGLTFPVQELYLEDVLDITGYKVGRNSRYALKKNANPSEAMPSNASFTDSGLDDQDMDNWESLAEDKGNEEVLPADVYSEATVHSLSIVDQSLINYDLIELIICAILQNTLTADTSTQILEDKVNGPERNLNSAVLVFLPGVAEIHRLRRLLKSSSQIAASHSGSLWVLALHGSLSSEEQRKVFSRPSSGIRKIVLATNIAETSVTIDDIVYVIDCGRHKEVRFDHNRGATCLEETWISKASAKQRRGRAGRVQSGYCIRLYSRQQFHTFEVQQLPEILRVSLDGLCLKMKSFFEEKIGDAASKIITPPELDALGTSLQNLQNLNALDTAERLTPVGHHLARMPVDARVGKMLLFGCMLRCLDPVATIAAALSARMPFLSPIDKRDEANAARLQFAGSSKSDHWAIVGAYNGWLNARQEGWNAESNYCMSNFLSRDALLGIEASREDFFKILADIGFLPRTGKGMNQTGDANELDTNIRVVKAVICAGFYPNIVRVLHPEKTFVQTEGGTVAKIAAARELRFFTKTDGRVFLHPGSVNFSVGKYESPWLIFSEKMKTSKVFLKDSTMVNAYGLLLFGGKVQVNHEKQSISVDDWLEFEAPARIAVLIKEMRSKVDSLLLEKIQKPSLTISSSPVVSALIRLLTTDGF